MAIMKKVSGLTYADFLQLPEDNKRSELFDGELIVSPLPRFLHQRAVMSLFRVLDDAYPDDVDVFPVPFDWLVDDRNVYEPDLLVAPRDAFTERNLPVPPLLAVEVLSPSNRSHDLVRKRNAYARAGLENYWIVDPDIPSITVLELVDGSYVERAMAKGDESLTVERPFPVTVRPTDLVA
jgi:Uma2 family endonuclease